MAEFEPKKFGKYLLLDRIGIGGMAEVYRAKVSGDKGFEKLIAVKKILPHLVGEKKMVDSFVSEARLAALLQHENIVRTFDFGKMDNDYFLAMEYLFGKDLHLVIQTSKAKKKNISLEIILHIASKVSAGLDFAHKLTDLHGNHLNIIHRDVNPLNIFITYDGQVKLVDFGIAKAASQNQATRLGVIKGKLSYMSPEQASGKPIDNRSDIFAVGIFLYELLTGTRMFTGETMEILEKVRNAQFVPPEKQKRIPPELCDVLDKALAKDPSKRYLSCAQMQADLEDCIHGLGLRPTQRGLADYMATLFEKEILLEEQEQRAVAKDHFAKVAKEFEKTLVMQNARDKPLILLVDDNEVNQKWLSGILGKNGYSTVEAADGHQALAVARRERPDLILLDVVMPVKDGYETCVDLKSDPSTANIPVVFLSARDTVEDKVKGLDAGGVDYLGKPFERKELLARVRAHLRSSSS